MDLAPLTVKTAISEPDQVTLAVQDSGPGVDPADLERIFDAFYPAVSGWACRSAVRSLRRIGANYGPLLARHMARPLS
jgi:signal transduction histidine kinase